MSAIRELDAFVQDPLSQAIGWALLQFVWQGALIGVLTAITLAVLRRSAADVRYVVATIALSVMLTVPVVTAVQGINAARRPSQSEAVALRPVTASSQPREAPLSSTGVVRQTQRDTESGRRLSDDDPFREASATAMLGPWLLLGWTAGVLLLTLRLLSGWLWVQRIKTRGASPARDSLRQIGERLARRLHVSRSVRLLESTLVEVPTVIGWLKPVVLLPASALAGLSPLQLEAILAHELAHIRRHDYLVNLLQTLVETLLFYHPAVWWVSRQIRIERENCCDDLAVSLCGDPVVYAQALADLEQLRGSRGQLMMAATGGSLLHRVRRLLGAPSHAGRGPGWLAGGVAVVLIVMMAGIAGGAIVRDSAQRAAVGARSTKLKDKAASAGRAAQRPIRQGANEIRNGANELRRSANELRRQANELRRGVNEIRRDANDLRRRAPDRVSRALRETSREFNNILRRMRRAWNETLHGSFPQIPPLPPLPPDPPVPPDPPTPPEPPVPPAPPIPPDPVDPPQPPEPPEPPVPPEPPAAPAFPMERVSIKRQSSGNLTWSHNGEKLEVNYRGDIEFTDDDMDVKSLTPGGWLRIKDGGWLGGHAIEFRADASGKIERRFWSGSSERPFEPEGRKWLAQVLPRFIRQTGIGARARVARIYKAKGAQGVLAEISLIEGSWAKRMYFSELLKTPGLDSRTVQQVLAQAGREVDSDFELASLLISADQLLTDDASRKAYLEAARSIQSDFEMRRVFSSALKRGQMSPAVVAALLETSTAIDSDFEQASLLIDVAKLQPLDGTTRAPFFKALETVNSDFEHRRVLSALMKRGDLSPAATGAVLESAATIGSDFEVASVLLEIAKNHAIEGALRAPFFRAVASLGSGFERGRVLKAVAQRADASEQTILEVIKATQQMNANFEASQVLLAVAATHPLTREARDAYIDAAEKLGNFEQGQVLTALVKNERRR